MNLNLNLNITKGFILRLSLTLVIFVYLSKINLSIDKHYLILPILLTILDFTDNIFTVFVPGCKIPCQRVKNNKFYQLQDKIIDALSYILVWYIFKLDDKYLYLTLYRLIGVFGYYHTNNKQLFILFPDLIKEFLVVDGFYGSKNTVPFIGVMVLKMIFEYYSHK